MRAHCIKGTILAWIAGWLDGGRQSDAINGSCSGGRTGTSGGPQESMMGPFFFMMYFKDLDTWIEGFEAIFADVAKLGGGARSV